MMTYSEKGHQKVKCSKCRQSFNLKIRRRHFSRSSGTQLLTQVKSVFVELQDHCACPFMSLDSAETSSYGFESFTTWIFDFVRYREKRVAFSKRKESS